LGGFSSPHFLLGLMAGFSMLDDLFVNANLGLSPVIERRFLAAHRRLSDMIGAGRRDEFLRATADLRNWLGTDFIDGAVRETTRIFEQILVQQVWGMPRF
jgi:hypothetical protein